MKTNNNNFIELNVNTKNKEFMFNLGVMFAKGCKINIKNDDEVNNLIKEEEKQNFSKSFNMMIKYWANNNLSPNIFVENLNKDGVFIICPVRNASEKEKKLINAYISNFEKCGKVVHYPQRNTNQNPFVNGINTGGYNICLQNARAIFGCKTTAIYYNKESVGSMFDLGVAYELITNDKTRSFQILNLKLELDRKDFIDNKILELFELNKQRNPSLGDLIENINKKI